MSQAIRAHISTRAHAASPVTGLHVSICTTQTRSAFSPSLTGHPGFFNCTTKVCLLSRTRVRQGGECPVPTHVRRSFTASSSPPFSFAASPAKLGRSYTWYGTAAGTTRFKKKKRKILRWSAAVWPSSWLPAGRKREAQRGR
jgi:hypothetical protein